MDRNRPQIDRSTAGKKNQPKENRGPRSLTDTGIERRRKIGSRERKKRTEKKQKIKQMGRRGTATIIKKTQKKKRERNQRRKQ
jgi:hypothetical protein